MKNETPQVAVVMGSQSDYPIMKDAVEMLARFSVPHEERILSAHRTPERLRDYARSAEQRGIRAIVAGAGGAAHLPGMLAAETLLPVFGVPIKSDAWEGIDSLLSMMQMPRGVPVATLSINGAANAALFAVAVLAGSDSTLKERLRHFRTEQTEQVPLTPTDKHPLNPPRFNGSPDSPAEDPASLAARS